MERIIASDCEPGSSEIPDADLPRTLVDMFGNELFEGKLGADLRGKILDKLFEQESYQKIFRIYLGSKSHNNDITRNLTIKFKANQKDEAREYLNSMKKDRKKYPWRPGGVFARRFVECIGIADVFSGIKSDPRLERIEEAIPKADLKELRPFQQNMKKQVLEILEGSGDNRAIVTLPTGAGKTRIVVEAIVEFLNKTSVDQNILWIAQSQEVCEQAVLCFKQIWERYGKGDILSIFRAWGTNDLPAADERGIIVGSVQKLISRKSNLHCISDDDALSAVFIDEAHHSVASSYPEILDRLGMSALPHGPRPNDKIPLVGLTATPERRHDSETVRLLKMYGDKRIYPRKDLKPDSESNGIVFDERWRDLKFMRERLEVLKYLARADFIPIEPGKIFKLNKSETKDFESGGDIWIERIATEPERNNNIKNAILEEANTGRKILYFGTNVSQSNAMSRILEKNGFRSVCITADTRYATRKLYVDTFNKNGNNEIQIMCNYNVLSTGFDSPKIDTVIIARPTTSIVAYQQAVGRGLRGEKFGGRPGNRCRIITVKDNIRKFNNEAVKMGYEKFVTDYETFDTSIGDAARTE